MPWERGFAGMVLNPRGNVLPLECLKESSRSAKAIDIKVDLPSESRDETTVKPSFVLKEGTKLPWDRAQTEERETKFLLGGDRDCRGGIVLEGGGNGEAEW